jgi:hypothetical protein
VPDTYTQGILRQEQLLRHQRFRRELTRAWACFAVAAVVVFLVMVL